MKKTQDEDHLNLLSIFHYVVGGLAALFAFFPIIHLVIGLFVLLGGFEEANGDDEFPARVFGIIFVVFPLIFMVLGWTFAGLLIAAGRQLSKRKCYKFCLVIAGIECIFMPFGTVLGVFTIIVLSRPTVKALFEANIAL
ncbi:MAG: hypothetical protein ACYSSP_09915 [Planctomycetota bacterium]|jgi:hypothetical protein